MDVKLRETRGLIDAFKSEASNLEDREFYQRLTDLKARHQQTLNFCEQLLFKQQANQRLNLQNPQEPYVVRGTADAGPLGIPRPSNIGAHRAITKLSHSLRGKQPVLPSSKAASHLSSEHKRRVTQQLYEPGPERPLDTPILQESVHMFSSHSSDVEALSQSSGDVSPEDYSEGASLANGIDTMVGGSQLERSDSAYSLPDTARERERLFRAPLVSDYPNESRSVAPRERSSKAFAGGSTRPLRQRSNSANGRVPSHRHRPELWDNGLRQTATTMEELLEKYVGTGEDWHHRLTIPRPFSMSKREEREGLKSRRQNFLEEVQYSYGVVSPRKNHPDLYILV